MLEIKTVIQQTNFPKFFSIWAAGFSMTDIKIVGFVVLLSFNSRNYCIFCFSPKIYLEVVIGSIEGTFLITYV
jgi:hypothetical protein